MTQEVSGAAPVSRLAYTVAEAAQAIGVSTRTIDRMIARGDLRKAKGLGAVRIPLTSLNEWLAGEAAPRSRRRARQ